MKKILMFLLPVIFVLIVSGCSIFPPPPDIEINYYDIGFPLKTINPETGIYLNTFDGGIGNESKMVFRDSSNNVQFDSFNRWCFPPAKLIQRYLSLAFDDKKIAPVTYLISGEIIRFDGDLTKKTANLSLKIDIKSTRDNELVSSEVYQIEKPVQEKTATAYAAAMENGIVEITKKIEKQIKQIEKK